METGRIQAMNGSIELKRPPGQRMPVRGVRCKEGPASIGPAQPFADLGKLCDILRVIVVEKLGLEGGSEYAERNDEQSGPRAFSEEVIHGRRMRQAIFSPILIRYAPPGASQNGFSGEK